MINYALIEVSSGQVVNLIVLDDTTDWTPPDGFIVVQTDTASIGWSYVDGVFVAPAVIPQPPEDILRANTATRDSLLSQAALAIAPLQDAVDLDDATPDEVALLKKWKQYRVAVNRIDLVLLAPAWPAAPE
jgi:hypothetical protein